MWLSWNAEARPRGYGFSLIKLPVEAVCCVELDEGVNGVWRAGNSEACDRLIHHLILNKAYF